MPCTVTGHVTDAAGNGLIGAVVYFRLVDSQKLQVFGGDQPRVSGSETIFVPLADQVIAGAGGAFSIVLNGNDVISPTGTMYAVSYSYNGFAWGPIYYTITGTSFDLDSAIPGPAPAPPFVIALTMSVTSSAAGNFTVAHGLGRVPNFAIITPTSGGSIWFQQPTMYDASNLYLIASDASVSAKIYLF